MFDFAINNEAIQGSAPAPLLTNNPYLGDMSIMAETVLTKICSKCKVEKSLSEFCRDNHAKDGLRSTCRSCHSARAKQYRKDHKKETAERRRKYHQENKEKISIRYKIYADAHKKEKAAYYKQYCQTDTGKAVRHKSKHKRRALKMKVKCENFNPLRVFERDKYRCQLCGKKTRPDFNQWHPLYPHLDHIVPLSLGGEHSKRNTQCLCRLCNLTKNNTGKGDQLRLFG